MKYAYFCGLHNLKLEFGIHTGKKKQQLMFILDIWAEKRQIIQHLIYETWWECSTSSNI